MSMNIYQKVCLLFLFILFIFWLGLFVSNSKIGFYNYLYSFLFGLIPLVGGIIAIINSRLWGLFKSAIGKAVFFVGLGIFLWGCGEVIWSYYNFFQGVSAPYPSLADLGFAPSIFFYGLGVVYLSKATGAKFGLRDNKSKIFVAISPLIILAASYYVLVIVARGGVLTSTEEGVSIKTLFDLAYPFGDFLSLTIAVIISGLSFRYFGGRFKRDIISILSGLAVMFFADSIFSYTTTIGTYYNGDLGDLILTIGLFLITFGVLGFCKIPKSLEIST